MNLINKIDKYLEGRRDEDYDFELGDRVRLKKDYADIDPNEIFTLVSWDGRKGRIEDKHGRGWGISGNQIEPVRKRR